jgi:predicted  nucleic acid-binding Zn-ribbon protein
MPAAAGSNGMMACQSPTTHAKKRLGTVSGERFATLGDLELALQAAIHVNQHLNREIEAVLNRLHKAEQERTAWQQRAQHLAKQLAKERRLRSPAGEAGRRRQHGHSARHAEQYIIPSSSVCINQAPRHACIH